MKTETRTYCCRCGRKLNKLRQVFDTMPPHHVDIWICSYHGEVPRDERLWLTDQEREAAREKEENRD